MLMAGPNGDPVRAGLLPLLDHRLAWPPVSLQLAHQPISSSEKEVSMRWSTQEHLVMKGTGQVEG